MKKKRKLKFLDTMTEDHGPCPRCGELIDSHIMASRTTEKPARELATGELTPDTICICGYCATMLVMEDDKPFREVYLHELTTLRGMFPECYRKLMALKGWYDAKLKQKVPQWMR